MNTFKAFNTWRTKDSIILGHTKKNKNTIYGARSIQKQIGQLKARPTQDWDIYSRQPNKHAKQMTSKFNRMSNSNAFYNKPAMHPGTFKVNHVGNDGIRNTKDDIGLVDYTKPPQGIKIKTIGGVQYSSLANSIKDKKSSLSQQEFAFRHKKDKDDLDRIRLHQKMKSNNLLRMFM